MQRIKAMQNAMGSIPELTLRGHTYVRSLQSNRSQLHQVLDAIEGGLPAVRGYMDQSRRSRCRTVCKCNVTELHAPALGIHGPRGDGLSHSQAVGQEVPGAAEVMKDATGQCGRLQAVE
jgi:hypothetical protein